jgi:hypothetical protein
MATAIPVTAMATAIPGTAMATAIPPTPTTPDIDIGLLFIGLGEAGDPDVDKQPGP